MPFTSFIGVVLSGAMRFLRCSCECLPGERGVMGCSIDDNEEADEVEEDEPRLRRVGVTALAVAVLMPSSLFSAVWLWL